MSLPKDIPLIHQKRKRSHRRNSSLETIDSPSATRDLDIYFEKSDVEEFLTSHLTYSKETQILSNPISKESLYDRFRQWALSSTSFVNRSRTANIARFVVLSLSILSCCNPSEEPMLPQVKMYHNGHFHNLDWNHDESLNLEPSDFIELQLQIRRKMRNKYSKDGKRILTDSDKVATPMSLLRKWHSRYNFAPFDPCPLDYDPSTHPNGLKIPWTSTTFVNPPYSHPEPWIRKAIKESKKHNIKVVMLLPHASNTNYWNLVVDNATEYHSCGYIAFDGYERSFRTPCVLVAFDPSEPTIQSLTSGRFSLEN